MLQMHNENQQKKAADEARERVYGTCNIGTPGKARSRSPSTRETEVTGKAPRNQSRTKSTRSSRFSDRDDSKERYRSASRRSQTKTREDPVPDQSPTANMVPEETEIQLAAVAREATTLAKREASAFEELLQKERLQQQYENEAATELLGKLACSNFMEQEERILTPTDTRISLQNWQRKSRYPLRATFFLFHDHFVTPAIDFKY